MEQLNKVELKGNVGHIKVQEIGNNQVAKFSLATNYSFKTKDGNSVVETTWHNIVAWAGKGMPENLNSIQKGDNLYVTGRLKQNKFTGNDGLEHCVVEVVAKSVEIISESRQDNNSL